MIPPSALLSLLVGFPISVEVAVQSPEMVDTIQCGNSPRETLECLRLSSLSASTLRKFDAYVAYRASLESYNQLSLSERLKQVAPLPPTFSRWTPSDSYVEQEALYDLAVNAASMPRLRLLILELESTYKLYGPRNLSREARNQPDQHRPRYSSNEALGRVHRYNAPSFHSAMRRAAAGDDVGNLDAVMNAERVRWEEYHASERDAYWREIQAGKHALIDLWKRCRLESSSVDSDAVIPEMEIRVVASRPNQWDANELLQDFRCQTDNIAVTAPSSEDRGANEGNARTHRGPLSTWVPGPIKMCSHSSRLRRGFRTAR